MSCSDKYVRIGYEYAKSVANDLAIAVAEERWCKADQDAQILQCLIEEHIGGIEQGVRKRLSYGGEVLGIKFKSWVITNQLIVDMSSRLAATVNNHEQCDAAAQLALLVALLEQSTLEALYAVFRLEPLSSGISRELSDLLRKLGSTLGRCS